MVREGPILLEGRSSIMAFKYWFEAIKPYIAPSEKLHELTFFPLDIGIVSVLSLAVPRSPGFKGRSDGECLDSRGGLVDHNFSKVLSKVFGIRKATILENNIVQNDGLRWRIDRLAIRN